LQAQLTKFGDLSQGNSQKMTSYVNAFSQAAAKGKADMQVLNTYLHQGVPILDALAKNFNVTTAEIVKMSSEGQISFSDFSKALDDLTAAGGQYFGGMELASKSLAAMQEGLKEAVNSLAASFGEMLLPAAIAVVGALTDIANAVNESPILKGLLVGALVAITGYLGAMAVKAGIAFAAQMSLNLAIGALNPVVLAATIAVAGLAAGYTIYAASQQKAAKEAEAFAYQQKQQNGAIKDATATLNDYINALKQVDDAKVKMELDFARKEKDAIVQSINDITKALDKANRDGNLSRSGYLKQLLEENARELLNANDSILAIQKLMDDRRTDWIEKMFSGSQEAKIKKINEELAIASGYLSGGNLSESDRTRLQVIVRGLNEELQRLQNRGEDINEKARKWKEDWAEVWGQFQADQSIDPFAGIEMERGKKLEDAWNNYVRSENKETIDQVNAYYDAQRGEIIRQLADEEGRIQRDLSRTKIDNLEYEMQEALRAIDTLETKRIIAAMNSEEEIAAIRERFSQMREDTMLQFTIEINKAKLDEARDAVRNWQEELSDNLLIITMNLKVFSDEAAVIISDLSARFIELSASAALSGFEEFGRALGEGKDAAESLQQAIANMAQQILKQLPMMFLQAGLQLIANGQWALGLGFIAAAGSSAIISGYVDGASKHAQGGVFDEYGKAARAFAAGGTFTNQIVNQPTYFKYGGNLGVMGEAGPEAVMPLRRMPSGNLGVETAGGGANVTVNIINNSNAEVRQEEHTDDEGNKQIDVMIGQLVNNHITLGKADRAMSRFGVRPVGV
jgi:tape measure domain-containing protein